MVQKFNDWPHLPTGETEEQRARAKKIRCALDIPQLFRLRVLIATQATR